jgi:hypothetical protein
MRRAAYALVIVALLSVVVALAALPQRADSQAPPMGGPPPAAGMAMPVMPVDSFVAERDSMIKVVLEELGDKQSMPAESVFHNLKIMKGFPAGQLVRGMNNFGRSLGVSCRYCHVPGHWKEDDKKPKKIAREMMGMTKAINEDYLGKIDFGEDDHPHVGCLTCHRGEKEPGHAMRQMMMGGRPGGPGGPGGPGDHR